MMPFIYICACFLHLFPSAAALLLTAVVNKLIHAISAQKSIQSKMSCPEREKKVREIRKMEGKISDLQDTIKQESIRYRTQVERDKSLRVKIIKDHKHQLIQDQDSQHRVPDRSFVIRSYSRMDISVWEYRQVRDWFNAYAPSPGQKKSISRYIDTGYTIEVGK